MPYKISKKGDKHCVVVSEGPDAGKQIHCHDTKSKAMAQMRALYANEAAARVDGAHKFEGIPCYDEACDRRFLTTSQMFEHAEAVHTFEDIRRMVAEAVREKYGKEGDYKASPVVPSVWAWIDDLADDWVAFVVESGTESTLYKSSYTILDNVVTLGDPVEVRRRTVYEPVKRES